MKGKTLWPVLVVSLAALAGCAPARGTATAVGAARQGAEAGERIVEAYHQAVMESFDRARALHVAEAKRVADALEAQERLTAEAVKEGFDRLLSNLDAVEARRAKFEELRRLAKQNNAAVLEALRAADSLAAAGDETRRRIEGLLGMAAQAEPGEAR